MSDGDRLDRILTTDPTELASSYDRWAATYDADHDGWGWRGPDLVADAVVRLGKPAPEQAICDAGCGTGKAGVALRAAGWSGRLVGVDLSGGMLEIAAASQAYDELICCSLFEIPIRDGRFGAVVASGVFTHGHVGGEAFAELVRIAAPGGVISITQRLDIESQLADHATVLAKTGRWELVERATPGSLHPERDPTEQTVTTWRVS